MSVDVSTQGVNSSVAGDERKPLVSKWAVIGGIAGVVVILALVIALVLWMASRFPAQIEAVRDVFIIIFAAGACASVVVLVMLLVAVIRLINMLEFEIKPILENTNETITTLRGTTTFVSTNVVKPTIAVRSRLAGIRRGLKVLFGDPRRNLPE